MITAVGFHCMVIKYVFIDHKIKISFPLKTDHHYPAIILHILSKSIYKVRNILLKIAKIMCSLIKIVTNTIIFPGMQRKYFSENSSQKSNQRIL